jgi:integrase
MTKAKRRTPGEGGAYRYRTAAGERWMWKAVIKLADGTSKQVALRKGPDGEPFLTKKEALAAMSKAQGASGTGGFVNPSKQSTGEYLAEWLAGQSQLRPSTMASYRKNIRLHLVPHIGAIPLASLTATRVSALYRQLEKSGRADHREGEGLSARTVRYIAMILSSALAEAVETGRLAVNPAAKAKPPTAEQARAPEMHPWTEHELKDVFLPWSAASSPHHVAWRVLAYTGARRGEVLELRWRDWDPETATMKIRRSAGVIRNAGEGATVAVGLTKTGRDRSVTVDAETAVLLKSWRLERARLGLHLAGPDSLIFSDMEGRHLHPERFSRTFQDTLARCRKVHPDLPMIRLHDLRHTHATILLRKRVPVKAVSVRLGHSSAVVTMTVYAGWMPADDADAAAVFAGDAVAESR